MNPFLPLIAAVLLDPQAPPSVPRADPPPAPAPQQPPPPMPVPTAVALHRDQRKIEVDGSLLDWPELPALQLADARQLSGTAPGAWRGEKDCSGYVFLLWDEQYLYVAASVQDEWHRALTAEQLSLTEIPPADSIVLTFDPERNTRSLGPDPGRADDREYWLAEEASHQLVQWDRLRGSARIVADGKQVVSHDKEKGITTYEARIPWADILPAGKSPAAGLVFDLQVVINDFDEATDPMPQTRIGWTFGCGPRIDPGLFGSVVLVRDAKDLSDHLPEVPPRAKLPPPTDGPEYWDRMLQRLAQSSPGVHDGNAPPESVGGLERIKLLEELDDHAERFPRVDWLELHYRIHRRMTREIAGISATGLPYFWYQVVTRLSARAEANPPDGTTRIHRLPMGGWLVRSSKRNFAVDPAGADLAHWLWNGMEFVVLTQPLDVTRRNDQLLIRMLADKQPRPFLTHAVFHLPMVKMDQIKVVEPGATYGQDSGVQIQALGNKGQDGAVPYSLGYRITLPNGASLLFAGPSFRGDDLPKEHSTALVLSPRNADAAMIAKTADVDLVLIDDLFLPQTFPLARRVRIADAFALQKDILPRRSVVLAPGESWDLTAGK